MRPITAIVLLTTLSIGFTQDTTSTNTYDDKTNTIESKPSVRYIDPYIRKALLKALSDLEENQTITDSDAIDGTTSDNTNTDNYATQTSKDNIKIHSFVVNGQEAFTGKTNSPPLVVDKNISILSTTAGNVETHLTGTLPTQDPFPEIFQTKETGTNLQQVRSIQGTNSNSNKNDLNRLSNFKAFRTSTTTTSTTTTTTTTTTPKPTHNDDGENIEDVDKRDVQVFQAPLVAAFTVQQDAHGIPKKVIPIFQQLNNNHELKLASTNLISNSISKAPNDFLALQLNLQRELEEKQRVLEEQLRLLQLHQRQQEELLRHQQLLLQQKEAQRQRQLLLEQEQFKKLLFEQQKGTGNVLQSNFLNKQVPQNQISPSGLLPQSSQVSIQQSVALDQTKLVGNQQQLPNREAVDFLLHLRNQQPGQFPLQENHLPQGIDNFLRPKPTPTFNQGPLINHIPGLDELPQKHANRVFRQENGIGNFGINNQNYNRFNTFGPINSNRFFPVTRHNNFNSNLELNQLLAQRGIDGRSHEDLNIVSKVLSLNHGIPLNNVSNRLPFETRRPVRTIL